MTQSVNPKKSGMSGWLVALVVILGLSAAVGIAFTSYTYYVRYAKSFRRVTLFSLSCRGFCVFFYCLARILDPQRLFACTLHKVHR